MELLGVNSNAKLLAFMKEIKEFGFVSNTVSENLPNGHHIIDTRGKESKIYLLFKREFFNTFESKFPIVIYRLPEMRGVGESINKEALDIAIMRNCDYVVFIHESEVYITYPRIIKNLCEKYKLIRVQKKGNMYNMKDCSGQSSEIFETTYSFPKALLQKFEDKFERLIQND